MRIASPIVSSPRMGRRWPEGSDEGASSPNIADVAPSSRCRGLLPGGEKKQGSRARPITRAQEISLLRLNALQRRVLQIDPACLVRQEFGADDAHPGVVRIVVAFGNGLLRRFCGLLLFGGVLRLVTLG